MGLGAFPTRFEGWSRAPALGLMAALLAMLAIATWSPPAAPAPKLRASPAEQSDLDLYRDIIAGVSNGGGYYEVAAEELRKGREGVMSEVSRNEEAIALALTELTGQIQGMAAKLNGKPAVN